MTTRIIMAAILTSVFVISAIASASEKYDIVAEFNLDQSTLTATAKVSMPAELAGDDVVIFSTRFSPELMIHIEKITLEGTPVEYQEISGQVTAFLPEGRTLEAGTPLDVAFTVRGVPEFEGIFSFDDTMRAGERYSWYPRLVRDSSARASYNVTFSIAGPGLLAHSAPASRTGETDSGLSYTFSDTAGNGITLFYSPIFVEKRVAVAGCDLGLFYREGSDQWGERLLTVLSEVFEYYARTIPDFGANRLDVVLAGDEYDYGSGAGFLPVIRDEAEQLGQEYGNVFATNYLNWSASVQLPLAFFSARLLTAGGELPWLQQGLALYYAERYSRDALIGGPAFDNIKTYYLTAARAGGKTVLSGSGRIAGDDQMLVRSKGFWVTSMLAERIGRNGMNRFIRQLLIGSEERAIGEAELEKAANDAGFGDFASFYSSWITGDSIVDYALDDVERKGGGYEIWLENKGTIAEPVEVRAIFVDGSEKTETLAFATGRKSLVMEAASNLQRITLDPDNKLPDVNRGNNMKSFGGSERIELLYSLDDNIVVGDLQLVDQPVLRGKNKVAHFRLSLTNREEKSSFLGIRLTSIFPGKRNRGITRLLVELRPGESKTVIDEMLFPNDGEGLTRVTAEYFLLSSPEAFKRIRKNDKPSLVERFVFNIE